MLLLLLLLLLLLQRLLCNFICVAERFCALISNSRRDIMRNCQRIINVVLGGVGTQHPCRAVIVKIAKPSPHTKSPNGAVMFVAAFVLVCCKQFHILTTQCVDRATGGGAVRRKCVVIISCNNLQLPDARSYPAMNKTYNNKIKRGYEVFSLL